MGFRLNIRSYFSHNYYNCFLEKRDETDREDAGTVQNFQSGRVGRGLFFAKNINIAKKYS